MKFNVDPDTQRSVTWIFGLLGLVEQAVGAALFHVAPSQWLCVCFLGCIFGGEAAARILERGRNDKSGGGKGD